MSVQDDFRENRMLDLFNLERPPNRSRHGVDAILQIQDRVLEFELKSVTTARGGLTTVRDFGPDHIAKWKDKHWLVSVYRGADLLYCKYGSPAAMAPWIEKMWNYIRADFELAKYIPELITVQVMHQIIGDREVYTLSDAKSLHKAQYSQNRYLSLMDSPAPEGTGRAHGGYSPARMLDILKDRVRYVIERGSTLNNPHIPASYLSGWEEIKQDHALRLRELVKAWFDANEPQARLPLQELRDTP